MSGTDPVWTGPAVELHRAFATVRRDLGLDRESCVEVRLVEPAVEEWVPQHALPGCAPGAFLDLPFRVSAAHPEHFHYAFQEPPEAPGGGVERLRPVWQPWPYRCVLCGRFQADTARRVSWHIWRRHRGVNKRFRGSLWRSR